MILTQSVDGEAVRTITVVPYLYDADAASAVVFTQEEGAVAISEADTPEMWAQFLSQKT